MGAPAIGQVVLVPFPFSDLSHAKMRPAVILAATGHGDWILYQVTSNPYGDDKAITLTNRDFKSGSLKVTSYARPGKLFTANESLIAKTVGILRNQTKNELVGAVIALFEASLSRQKN